MTYLQSFGDFFLFLTTFLILGASLYLSFSTRFIQFRKIPYMLRLFFSSLLNRKSAQGEKTIKAHHALFTAMSTTIGISTIVSPVIAIRMGGPGAVLGFLLATILGAAVHFTEVTFALSYRKSHPEKGVSGGPMQYLKAEIHPLVAKGYAFFGVLLLMGWSAAQSNQLSEILASPYLGGFAIPEWVTGLVLTALLLILLIGGIKRIASFSSKLVPVMFLLYLSGSFWILFSNLEKIPGVLHTILVSSLHPKQFAIGVSVGGIVAALRWGVFKGLQSSEAGIGTQTIPHSMAETDDPVDQGILAMFSTYSAGFICLLSSLVTLVTETWLNPELSLGIEMVASSFALYFSQVGVALVVLSAFLFAFGTILGNSYNGSQCYSYAMNHRFSFFYYIGTALLVFFGCLADVRVIWALVDYLLIPVAIPHILSLAYLTYRQKHLLFLST